MLIVPSDSDRQIDCPDVIHRFLTFINDGLENSWTVSLTAFDNDVSDEVESISVEISATHGELEISVTRHAGCDTVVLGLQDGIRSFPFEDVAAVCGWASTEDVLALLDQDPTEFEPLFTLEDILKMIHRSRDELTENLKSGQFIACLDGIATQFQKQLFDIDSRPR